MPGPPPLVKHKPNEFQFSSVLGLSTVGPRPMRIRRIKQHLAIIGEDDALLLRENAISSLRENDLRDALEERGMWVPFLDKRFSAALTWYNVSHPAWPMAIQESSLNHGFSGGSTKCEAHHIRTTLTQFVIELYWSRRLLLANFSLSPFDCTHRDLFTIRLYYCEDHPSLLLPSGCMTHWTNWWFHDS